PVSYTLSLHDALPISFAQAEEAAAADDDGDGLAGLIDDHAFDVADELALDAADQRADELSVRRSVGLAGRIGRGGLDHQPRLLGDRKSTRLNSSHSQI